MITAKKRGTYNYAGRQKLLQVLKESIKAALKQWLWMLSTCTLHTVRETVKPMTQEMDTTDKLIFDIEAKIKGLKVQQLVSFGKLISKSKSKQ